MHQLQLRASGKVGDATAVFGWRKSLTKVTGAKESLFCVSCAMSAPHLYQCTIHLCHRTVMTPNTQSLSTHGEELSSYSQLRSLNVFFWCICLYSSMFLAALNVCLCLDSPLSQSVCLFASACLSVSALVVCFTVSGFLCLFSMFTFVSPVCVPVAQRLSSCYTSSFSQNVPVLFPAARLFRLEWSGWQTQSWHK